MNIWFPQLAVKYIKIAYGAEACSKEHIESWPHSGRASSHAPQLHPLWECMCSVGTFASFEYAGRGH